MPEFALIRAYLDANILFSASYSEQNRFLQFWQLRDVTPVTSPYAIAEARGHAKRPGHLERLNGLLKQTELVGDADLRCIPRDVALVAKDLPILAAAIGARVDYLVTGDKNHFGHLCDRSISGVVILLPADFLDRYAYRLIDGSLT